MIMSEQATTQDQTAKIRFYKRAVLRYVLLFLVVGGIAVLSFQMGYSYRDAHTVPSTGPVVGIANKDNVAIEEKADFAIFWDTWKAIEDIHVNRKNLDYKKMVSGAVKGLVNSLGDPYSEFFTPEENKLFMEDMQGSFEGVGMEIGIKKGVLTVVAPLKGTPAEKAGLLSGDKIIMIDKKSTSEMSLNEAVAAIRGKKGTEVVLTIFRESDGEEPKEIKVTRDTITVPSFLFEIKETQSGPIAYVHLYQFSQDVGSEMKKIGEEVGRKGITRMILDLRNNPGGYLSASVDVASFFLPEGETVAIESFGDDNKNTYVSRGIRGYLQNVSLVILINEGSASASEILAGALSEHKKAITVGKKSFGKGSVQEMYDMRDNAAIKLTVAKWLTPSGRSVSEEGIAPDVVVEITKEDAEAKNDVQLNKALELLSKVK
jgi:carboxyl-terminal processing protease